MTDARREEQLRIQAVGAAISRRDWHAVEQAYNAIRDEFDRRPNGAGSALDREWLKTEISAIDTWYRGDPSYMHDAYWMKDRVLKLLDHPAALSSPATPEPADPTGITRSIRALAEGDPAHLTLLTEDEAKAAIANAKAWLVARGATAEPEVVSVAWMRAKIEDYKLDALPGSEYRQACDDILEVIAALSNPAPGHGEGGL